MTLQAKLGVADEEFAKWKFAFINNLQKPEYLTDDDVVAARFPRQTGTQGLGSQEVPARAPFVILTSRPPQRGSDLSLPKYRVQGNKVTR